MSVGTKNILAFCKTNEAAYGTPQATPDKAYPFRGNKPALAVEVADDTDSLTGLYEVGYNSCVTATRLDTSFDFDLRLDALALFLKWTLGTLTTTGTNPYTHTCTVFQGDAPSFTLYWRDALSTATKMSQYPGCKVSKLTLDGKAGDKWSMSVDIVGKGTTTEVVATAPAFDNSVILPFSIISTFTVGGVDYKARVTAFTLELTNDFDLNNEQAGSDISLSQLERTGCKVSGKFTLQRDSDALETPFLAQTGQPIVLTLTSGSTSATFNIYAAKLKSEDTEGQRSKNLVTWSFDGFYSSSDSKAIQVAVVNTTASY